MNNTLLIGTTIYNKLKSTPEITEIVGNKIFPIIAENNTVFPFITFTRTNVYSSVNTKDGWVDDKVTFQIVAASNTYKESVELANIIRNVIEVREFKDENIEVGYVHMTSISEMYTDETYIQTLNFECFAQ